MTVWCTRRFRRRRDGGEEIATGSVELALRSKTLGPAGVPALQQSPPPWAPEDVYDHFLFMGQLFKALLNSKISDHLGFAAERNVQPSDCFAISRMTV